MIKYKDTQTTKAAAPLSEWDENPATRSAGDILLAECQNNCDTILPICIS